MKNATAASNQIELLVGELPDTRRFGVVFHLVGGERVAALRGEGDDAGERGFFSRGRAIESRWRRPPDRST